MNKLILVVLLSLVFGQDIWAQEVNGKEIERLMDKFRKKGFSGTVLVAKGTEILLHKSVGHAQLEHGILISEKTKFPIGSVTKPITGMLVMKLVEEGKLTLTDKLELFFPNSPEDKKQITIHELLTHTAGFVNFLDYDDVLDSKERFLERVLQSKLIFDPGSNYSYSNIGYSLLSIIVGKVTGKGYEALLQEKIFRPLKIANSGYLNAKVEANDSLIAYGYDKNGLDGNPLEKPWLKDGPGWHLRGNGGLILSATDLYEILRALHSGEMVKPSTYGKIVTPHVKEQGNSYYGYGWVITKNKGKKVIRHNGGNPFFYTLVAYFPENDVYFILQSNKDTDRAVSMGERLLNDLFE